MSLELRVGFLFFHITERRILPSIALVAGGAAGAASRRRLKAQARARAGEVLNK